jgi:hypothetical protein
LQEECLTVLLQVDSSQLSLSLLNTRVQAELIPRVLYPFWVVILGIGLAGPTASLGVVVLKSWRVGWVLTVFPSNV